MREIIKGILIVMITIILTILFKLILGNTTIGNDERFVTIDKYDYYKIVYDKQTNVEYIVSYGSYNRGTFSILIDEEGNPLLYK